MNAYEAYGLYKALKAHFQTNYDFQKYQGKIKLESPDRFKSRADVFRFQKLAKHKDPQGLLVANFAYGAKWIGDIDEEIYISWLRRRQSLTYVFQEDIKKIPDLYKAFQVKKGELPQIVRLYFAKKIGLETLVILIDLLDCQDWLDKRLKSDPLWMELSKTIRAYRPFLQYEKLKYRQIALDQFIW